MKAQTPSHRKTLREIEFYLMSQDINVDFLKRWKKALLVARRDDFLLRQSVAKYVESY